MTILLILALMICAFGWASRWISCAILLWYLQEKGYPMPTDEEMAQGREWVVQHILTDLRGRKNKR